MALTINEGHRSYDILYDDIFQLNRSFVHYLTSPFSVRKYAVRKQAVS